ncbi:hypothetical protein DVH24_010074 [Malus domestica]|uniref:Uncharacterized protein n=1 Tax=Malus domestica TaxID=3750 RepID=A0A498JP88_MALDO|nr:hypothetical protein DVH24_010074 [Malus domestica]
MAASHIHAYSLPLMSHKFASETTSSSSSISHNLGFKIYTIVMKIFFQALAQERGDKWTNEVLGGSL